MDVEKQNLTVIYNVTNVCNMACKYCFEGQFDKDLNTSKKASNELFLSVMENLIDFLKQVQEWNETKKINLILHGGEPLLVKPNNYRIFFEKLKSCGIQTDTSIQTNATLINDEVIKLFKDYNIKVGISIDGNKKINDFQRVDCSGNSFFDKIYRGIIKCKEANIPVGCVATITKKTLANVKDFYEFFSQNDLAFRFNPIFAGKIPAADEKLYITAEEYGLFCIELFEHWMQDQENYCEITNFEDIIREFVEKIQVKSICTNSENCYLGFVSIDANGDLYHCHRMCGDSKLRVGNISYTPLKEFMLDASYMENRKRILKNSACKECSNWLFCNGGCTYNAYLKTGSFFEKDYFCNAYKTINEFVYNYIKQYEH